MDSQFGIQGKDFVILVADASSAYSILKFKDDVDKIISIDNNKLMSLGGPVGDRVQFGDYIQKSVHLYKFRNEVMMNTEETAQFVRQELATAIRRAPYQVSCMIAGIDESGPQLFWCDYLGCLLKSDKCAHGYASNFLLGLLDNLYKKDITEEEALQMVKKCINEMQTRFLISQPNFKVKCVDKNGIREIKI